jgi:hypothetical protein
MTGTMKPFGLPPLSSGIDYNITPMSLQETGTMRGG